MKTLAFEEFMAMEDEDFGGEYFQDKETLRDFVDEVKDLGVEEVRVAWKNRSDGSLYLKVMEQVPAGLVCAIASYNPDECSMAGRDVDADDKTWIRVWWD